MNTALILLESLIGCGEGISRGIKWDREVRFRSELETLTQEITGKPISEEEKYGKDRLLQLYKTGHDIRNSLLYGAAAQIAYLIFNDDKGFHFFGESMTAFAASYVAVSAASKVAQYVSMKYRHNQRLSAEDEQKIKEGRDALKQAAIEGKDLEPYVNRNMDIIYDIADRCHNVQQVSSLARAALDPEVNMLLYHQIKHFLECDSPGIGVRRFGDDQIYENGEALIVHEEATYSLRLDSASLVPISDGIIIDFKGQIIPLSPGCSVYELTKLVEERSEGREFYLVHSSEQRTLDAKVKAVILHYAQVSSLRISAVNAEQIGELN